ncbi:MAG: hypothetical protein HY275_08695, partial [Gemmatimonadetes bacterium]|nr:hypothetical protein [Gemmatimonadota bacterium]
MRTCCWLSARVTHTLVAVAVALCLWMLGACTEGVVALQNGRTRLPVDSAITVPVLGDRAQTFAIAAPPGTGIYLEVSATGGAARVAAGDAQSGLIPVTVGVDPTRGPVRSGTVGVPPTGAL